jgi:hypothetical protein
VGFPPPRHLPGDVSERFRQRRRTRPVEDRDSPVPRFPRGGIEILPDRDALPAHPNERHREFAVPAAQFRLKVPEFRFPETFAFLFTFHDQAHGDALYATRAEFRRDPLPENRRHLVPEKPIQDPSTLLRIHQVAIELP